ncbi:hypothetical protein NLI96_g5544 [Meripilus lineatus]|uniref:DUF6533 domain-containing protein n=1 Tax=Meripilus lineatus TaxID=2056292 RepID=A0AAD5YIX0_9APHY|nr:hypothetical protein NLI96_g5544 [Physisporinus lineatus]
MQAIILPLSVREALNMGKRSRIAAIALLAYDHFLNLELEVDLIWKEKKTRPGFGLYIFNRIFALTYLIFDSVVLQLRVYALYERSKKILIFLIVLCAIELGTMAILTGVTIGNMQNLPLASTPTGCYYHGVLSVSALFWVPGLVYEPILFALVAYKAWPLKQKGVTTPLIQRIARDSLIYFVMWSAALPSILGSRLMLNMREVVRSQGRSRSYILESYNPRETINFRDPDTSLEEETRVDTPTQTECSP